MMPAPRAGMSRGTGLRALDDLPELIERTERYFATLGTTNRRERNRGTIVDVAIDNPPTWQGLAVALGTCTSTVLRWCADPTDPERKAYLENVKARIENHWITQGAIGNLNASVATRYAGLTEKREQQITASVTAQANHVDPEDIPEHMHPDCTVEQLAELADAGVKPILYSKRQLACGVAYVHPL